MQPEHLAPFLDLARQPLARPETDAGLLEVLRDERDITDLMLRYGWLCDARQWTELFELYTDDFERTIVGSYSEHFAGKAALREYYATIATTAPSYTLRRIVSPPFVRVAADRGTARASVVYDLEREGGAVSRASYLWDARRDASEGWRFCRLFVATQVQVSSSSSG
jgi:SnoaL-like domain